MSFIETHNLKKKFVNGIVETTVLKGISLYIEKGEFVAIMGRSGAGKSTLLYQLSLLDDPTDGEVIIGGVQTRLFSQRERTQFRLNRLGYVFQDYALLPELTAKENVALPLLMQGKDADEAFTSAVQALTSVGLGMHCDSTQSKLSGGEQQRVSVARAIVHNPQILFADEPTANLDSETALSVLTIFRELNRNGQTIVMVTHEQEYGNLADRIITLHDGMIVS